MIESERELDMPDGWLWIADCIIWFWCGMAVRGFIDRKLSKN